MTLTLIRILRRNIFNYWLIILNDIVRNMFLYLFTFNGKFKIYLTPHYCLSCILNRSCHLIEQEAGRNKQPKSGALHTKVSGCCRRQDTLNACRTTGYHNVRSICKMDREIKRDKAPTLLHHTKMHVLTVHEPLDVIYEFLGMFLWSTRKVVREYWKQILTLLISRRPELRWFMLVTA